MHPCHDIGSQISLMSQIATRRPAVDPPHMVWVSQTEWYHGGAVGPRSQPGPPHGRPCVPETAWRPGRGVWGARECSATACENSRYELPEYACLPKKKKKRSWRQVPRILCVPGAPVEVSNATGWDHPACRRHQHLSPWLHTPRAQK